MADIDLAEGVQRIRVLYSTPHAIEILFAIRDGILPTKALPADADPHAIPNAIRLMERLGLIHIEHIDPGDVEAPTSITTTGTELATLLAVADEVDRRLITTPYAAEVLLGLQHGIQPAQAVPAEADPHAVMEAIQLLQRLQLIDTLTTT